ncbi:MAG: DUF4190 domain-containing protein [Thermoleophilia bacterium]|nr:DUF4190 domain-containing protein [Thermoleophilia bacterium]
MNTEMPRGSTPGPGTPLPGQPMPGAPGGPGMPVGGGPGAPGGGMQVPDKAGGLAIASLVFSLVGLLCCGVASIAGIILGAVELGRINRGESSVKGRGLALAGIIIGAVVIGLWLLIAMISIVTGGFAFEFGT